jgi:DNA modification methylase
LYLHCDPTASHYLKLLLDALFGPVNFRNEIVWKRTNAHNDAKRFGRIHDVLLFYAKSPAATWNRTYQPYDAEYAKRYYRYSDPDGRRWKSGDVTAPGNRGPLYRWNGHLRHWRFTRENMQGLHDAGRLYYTPRGIPRLKQYLDDMPGMPAQDIWADEATRYIVSWSGEGLGYPTQKPISVVKRIIEASSNRGDIVLDPFCGCGTAIEAAIESDRRWVGIDVSDQAYQVIERRFRDRYGESVPLGHIAPRDIATARTLATSKPHGRLDFEAWAINLVGARPNLGRDRGIDGVIPFVNQRGKVQRALVSVKSGKVKPADVRELKGTISRESAAVGLLVTLEDPSAEMRLEATSGGFYAPDIPRLQIVTISEALTGARAQIPRFQQQELFDEVPDTVGESALPRLLEELEEQIGSARAARRVRSQRELERIRDSVRRVMETEERHSAPGESRSLPRVRTR